jgi:hypothetical protein
VRPRSEPASFPPRRPRRGPLSRPAHGTPIASAPRATPLPGSLCEQCLDAPAVAVVVAPGGEDMGLCAACQERQGTSHPPVQAPPTAP